MAVFPLLDDPAAYVACLQDLRADPISRAYWIARFKRHTQVLAGLLHHGQPLERGGFWPELRAALLAAYDAVARDWRELESVTVLSLCEVRSRTLRRFKLHDAFAELKAAENELALRQYDRTIAELDAMADDRSRLERLVRGVLCANLADFGAVEALERYRQGVWDFPAELERLPPRPWPFDDLDEIVTRLAAPAGEPAGRSDETGSAVRFHVALFVDNSGPEFVLAVLPLARELAGRGRRVTLAANSGPALNDVTDTEARAMLGQAASIDPRLAAMLADGRVRVVDSGCHEPLLDLRSVSVHCANAVADCDLVVLIGMGRAIESNFDAVLSRDCIRLALAKDEMVARLLRVPLFSPVCRFTPAGRPPVRAPRGAA